MSLNYDLLKQIERERQTQSTEPLRARADSAWRTPQIQCTQELMGLAQTVFLADSADTPRDVLLCGVDRKNESSRISFELGRLLAAFSGHSVCLVEGDVLDARLSQRAKEFRVAIQNNSRSNGCTKIEPNLWIADPDLLDPNRSGVLADADALKRKLIELKCSFHFVLISAPGVNDRTDAGVLGQIVDATILVIEANSTRKAAALKAKKVLQGMGVRLLGTVLNNRLFPIPEGLYGRL